jgi:nucleoside-diphosphate-sugar epimerase
VHVFVTGATGFVGFHTVRALLDAGHTVRLGVRSFSKMQRLYQRYGVPIDEYSLGEVNDRGAVDAAIAGCDAVVHTAALVSLDPKQGDAMYRTNVLGTQTVIDSALVHGVKRIVHVSSITSLYDPTLSVICESTPLAKAKSAYARTKIESERYVRTLIERGAPIAITYPGGIVGPDDPSLSEANHALAIMVNYVHMVTTTGVQIIDVRDLARVHVGLLEQQQSGGFMVGGNYADWRTFGETLEKAAGHRLRTVVAPPQLLRIIAWIIGVISRIRPIETPVTPEAIQYATQWVRSDDSKVKRTLGIDFRPLQETMADAVAWMRAERIIKRK